jgi:hypothetical protein
MSRAVKYQTLVNVLDRICGEAPAHLKRYHVSEANQEALNQARSRAYIHLYVKVMYGLLDFTEREKWITDGSSDGGIDAYFIDYEQRRVDFIQSKFRTNADNFQEKEIALEELLAMDLERILDGETLSESGHEYNGKIKGLQRALQAIPDIGRFGYTVVVLANLREKKKLALRRLTGGFPTEVFDHARAYSELVFPVVSGTYYTQPTLCIQLDLTNTSSSNARVSHSVATEFKACDISLVFVPAGEIGRILYQYKNSILKFNLRSYLELANNSVNRDIASTIVDRTTNEFALFNNGITMLSDETDFNERVGVKDRAQVVVTNPQVLNGGQTAFTLSRLYEDVLKGSRGKEIFSNKEVLLKIITFSPGQSATPEARLRLIEDISRATNSQTEVKEADRRSNDKIQVDIQREIFERYGYYYERKRGEFADGIRDGYIERSHIVDREDFLRVCMACDLKVSQARGTNTRVLFGPENFTQTLKGTDRIEEYYLAYRCLVELGVLEKAARRDREDRWGFVAYGRALRYGKFAVVAVCASRWTDTAPEDAPSLVEDVLAQWIGFELHARDEAPNSAYFGKFTDPETGEVRQELNHDGYYKGRTVNADVRSFFSLGADEN